MDLRTSTRGTVVRRAPDAVWRVVAGAGPGSHWYADALPFRFRALLDRIAGGEPSAPVPDRALLRAGDRAGLWRVQEATDGVLDLVAVVRAPGTVRLRTTLTHAPDGTRIEQAVTFRPRGVLGTAYLLADLPARETLLTLVHRTLLREVAGQPAA